MSDVGTRRALGEHVRRPSRHLRFDQRIGGRCCSTGRLDQGVVAPSRAVPGGPARSQFCGRQAVVTPVHVVLVIAEDADESGCHERPAAVAFGHWYSGVEQPRERRVRRHRRRPRFTRSWCRSFACAMAAVSAAVASRSDSAVSSGSAPSAVASERAVFTSFRATAFRVCPLVSGRRRSGSRAIRASLACSEYGESRGASVSNGDIFTVQGVLINSVTAFPSRNGSGRPVDLSYRTNGSRVPQPPTDTPSRFRPGDSIA